MLDVTLFPAATIIEHFNAVEQLDSHIVLVGRLRLGIGPGCNVHGRTNPRLMALAHQPCVDSATSVRRERIRDMRFAR